MNTTNNNPPNVVLLYIRGIRIGIHYLHYLSICFYINVVAGGGRVNLGEKSGNQSCPAPGCGPCSTKVRDFMCCLKSLRGYRIIMVLDSLHDSLWVKVSNNHILTQNTVLFLVLPKTPILNYWVLGALGLMA